MSSVRSVTTSIVDTSDFTDPRGLFSAIEEAWTKANKRRAVRMTEPIEELREPYQMVSLPVWPGMGEVYTSADVVPIVTIPGMPPAMYTACAPALAAYTLAEIFATKPQFYQARTNVSFVRVVILSVAVRAGVWASLGAAPDSTTSATSTAVRWSSRAGGLVVRPATIDDGTSLWRSFLATLPALPSCTAEVMRTIAGLGPLFFLIGAARHQSSGEMFQAHFVEREMMSSLRMSLGRAARSQFALDQKSTWTTLAAAAVTGLRASVIRHVSEDAAYALRANMILAGKDAKHLAVRISELVSNSTESGRGVLSACASPVRFRAAPKELDDSVSVADTEADLETRLSEDFPDEMPSGAATPRANVAAAVPVPQIDHEDVEQIRAIAKKAQQEAPLIESMFRNMDDDQSAKW